MKRFIAIAACLALVACGDPVADIQRLSDQDIPEDSATVGVAARPDPQEGGLFQRLLGGGAKTGQDMAADTGAAPDEAEVVEAALSEPEATPRTKRRGLFGLGGLGGNSPEQAAAVSEIELGTVLPYGRVARICGLGKRDMGKQIAAHPERNPVHRIYDSEPGNTAPHSFYITGFSDGCARQFTASLAVFGSAAMHEQLRYGLPSEVQPYSDTDKAYEKVKSRVCGVPRKKPCGAKVSRLDRNTVFVSIYERFGSNSNWTNLLLHEGDVLAQDMKGG